MNWWRRLFDRSQLEHKMDAELRFHFDLQVKDYVRSGMAEQEARRQARLAFGGVEQIKEECRDARGLFIVESTIQDLRYALRGMRRSWVFTAVIILSLALGIGANTAIFSVVYTLILKPLPYPASEQLMVLVFEGGQAEPQQYWTYPLFENLRDRQTSFESVAVYASMEVAATVGEDPEKTKGEIVSANYFPLLGVEAALGRTFLSEEDRIPDAHQVIVLGHQFWERRLAGDSDVLGKTVFVNTQPFTVIGVMPHGFRGQSGTAELWVPIMMERALAPPGTPIPSSRLSTNTSWWLNVIGRLKPDVSEPKARAELGAISPAIFELIPARARDFLLKDSDQVGLVPLRDTKVDPAIKRAFLILLGAVGFVMLIACANTASLLLARSVARQREFAVRLAIGGGRRRLMRQVITETVLLGMLAGILGLVIAVGGIHWLTTAKPWNISGFWSGYGPTFDYFNVALDGQVLTFNFGLAIVTGVLFGLAPAYQACRPRLNDVLKQNAGSSISGTRLLRRPGVRTILIVAEIGLSLVLLVGAGLLIRSLNRLLAVDLGFEPEGVMTMTFDGPSSPNFYETFLDRLKGLPGVDSASVAMFTPLTGGELRADVELEGEGPVESRQFRAMHNVVSNDYFDTFRIPLLRGRVFDDQDRVGSARVAIVSRNIAEQAIPGIDLIGKRVKIVVRLSESDPWIQIVGIVDDVKYGAVDEQAEPTIYFSAAQGLLESDELSIRSRVAAVSLIPMVRRELQSIDRTMPVYGIVTMNDRAAEVTSRYRYSTMLMTVFASLAVLLCIIGIYGTMAYSVGQRNREMGVRLALGAQRAQLLRLIFFDGAILIVAGLLLGLPLAAATTRLLAAQLYEIQPMDLTTFVLIPLLLTAAAFLACYLPARRAANVDPNTALRWE